jgi:hypothetical protein
MSATTPFPPVQLDLLPRPSRGQTYRVYFGCDFRGMRKFFAKTPEAALELARSYAAENADYLALEYEPCDSPLNEIEVCDEEYNSLAIWQDDNMRLRLAAPDLLEAVEKVIANWQSGDLAEAMRELGAAVAKAKRGAG